MSHATPSTLLAAMADGIGEVSFASAQWVAEAAPELTAIAAKYADGLSDLGNFTLCEVTHNAPAYLHVGSTLAWHARFNGSNVTLAAGELPTAECDFKIEGDHSLFSNLARIQSHNRDPLLVNAARTRVLQLGKWERHGDYARHPVLAAVLREFHDALAARTMPRFVFMTPEWVSCARAILSSRAASEKYAVDLRDCSYVFSEEFTDTPKYAFPDGSHGGFWVQVERGQITVGAGPLPAELAPADALTKGSYTPVVPVGRTVNAALTEEEAKAVASYSKAAFRFDKATMQRPVEQTSPSGKGQMPDVLSRVFLPLHDELSKRTSGEIPADYWQADAHGDAVNPAWTVPQSFDRPAGYDASWVRYDEFDIYAKPLN